MAMTSAPAEDSDQMLERKRKALLDQVLSAFLSQANDLLLEFALYEQ